ncbi:MAG TPA: sigma-70 family RNA polymerase sigma factor [Nannocystaceae bacterium]|nr:sigma-70 family RNA polymerase sigma factor [Nannocystaceae bacterium]
MADELELLQRWRGGDEAAGAELFRHYFPPLRRFFRNKIAPEDVEDVLQRVFLACVESREAFRGDSSFRTYLFTIARHELYRHIRKRAHDLVGRGLDVTMTSIAELALSPSSAIARDEQHALILGALQRLSIEQQLMLELKYWENLSSAEIAAIMEIAEATVRTRLFRARQALRAELHATLGERGLDGVVAAARP